MDMQQRQLKGYQVINRNENGDIVSVEVLVFGRDENGKAIEILVEKEEWQVIDGLNQRVN
jgi:hypothetical protein